MKILLVSQVPVVFEKFRKPGDEFPYFTGQAAWLKTLRQLKHRVRVFRYTDSVLIPNKIRILFQERLAKGFPLWYARGLKLRSRFYQFLLENHLRNQRLIKMAFDFKPEFLIISGGTNVVFPQTIRLIKQRLKTTVVMINGTAPVCCATQTEKKMINDIDYFVTNDQYHAQDWLMMGAKRALCLPVSGVDPGLHKKLKLSSKEIKEYGADVCFVGSLNSRRVKILSQLNQFQLKVWGDSHIGVGLASLADCYQGEARGEKMVKIFNACKIVLNFHPIQMQHGGNMRTFEISGSGAFQLVDRTDSHWFIPDKEVVIFSNLKDLKKKIRYYLKHEKDRQIIAQAGYNRAHRDHTYKKRFQNLIQILKRND